MELRTWSPFDLERDWRLFDFPRFAREITGLEFRPSIDVVKEETEIVVTAELPGMDPNDIDVALDGDVLTIRGEKAEDRETAEDDRYVRERTYGRFERRITLPDGIDADRMKATYDQGVLVVRVEIPEEISDQPKHIPIKMSSAS